MADYYANCKIVYSCLNNLPTMPSGKTLQDLINDYSADKDTLKSQLNQAQQDFNQEKQAHQQTQQKLTDKEKSCKEEKVKLLKETVEKINTQLELKLTNPTLEQVIAKTQELLRHPDNAASLASLQNQLNQANQTITDLQEQLTNSEKLKVIRQITIQTIEKTISLKAGRELSKKIANLNDLQAIKDLEKEMITKYLTNKEICQAKKDKLTKQIETERTVFIILLLTSLLTIGGLIYKLKTGSRKK